jgi:hypothetical protein
MKRKLIAYWICTVIIALCIGSGGAAQLCACSRTSTG